MRKTAVFSVGLRFLPLVALGILLTVPASAQTLSIPGTGACELILAELAAAYNKGSMGSPVSVPPSTGSGGGIDAVLKDQASLARVARALKPEEKNQGLVQTVFARDTIAFVVGERVAVANLTADQLAAIFSRKDHQLEGGRQAGGRYPGGH